MPRNPNSLISDQERANRSVGQKLRWKKLTDEERDAQLHRLHSSEAKLRGQDARAARYAEGRKRKPTTQVTKSRQSAALMGIPHSAERRENIRKGVEAARAARVAAAQTKACSYLSLEA